MTVSRSGKRGAIRMRPASRNGRVRHNAAIGRARGDIGHASKRDWVYHARGIDDWNPDVRPANDTDNLSPDALKHGRYEVAKSYYRKSDLDPPELDPFVVNRAVTVIDDWIDGDVFYGYQVRVIEKTRDLWRDIRQPRHPLFDRPDLEDRDDGFEAARAQALLNRCRRLVGSSRWEIFENIVRWNEPTGIPGSKIAHLSVESIEAAQRVVRGVTAELREIL